MLSGAFCTVFQTVDESKWKGGNIVTAKSGKLPTGLSKHSPRYNGTDTSDAVHGQEPEIVFGFAKARHLQTCTRKAVYKWTDTKTTKNIQC